jgi:dynein heavy chain
MPVILVKAIQASGKGKSERQSDVYDCPVYKTRQRGSSYIWRVGLRSKVPTSTWVMAGVGLIMEI